MTATAREQASHVARGTGWESLVSAAQKMSAGAATPALEQSGQVPVSTNAIVGHARRGANLSDAWNGRFLSDPPRFRRVLGKLFQRSYLECDEAGAETGRTLVSVPFEELARCTSSSRSTVIRAVEHYLAAGVLERVEGDYFTDFRGKLETFKPRRDPDHRHPKGALDPRAARGRARQAAGGRFTPRNVAGSDSGRPHVFLIKVKSGDELTARRPAIRWMHRAWGPELDGLSSADREVFGWLLAHANFGKDFPELRDCAWPSIDGRTPHERGKGALALRSKLSRSSLYRSIHRLKLAGRIEPVMLRKVRGVVEGVWPDDEAAQQELRAVKARRVRGWRIAPPPAHDQRPRLAAVRLDPVTRGQVKMGPNPGQDETRPPVNLGHEVNGSEEIPSKEGTPERASPAGTEDERPSAAGLTSAAPTGAEVEPRPAQGAPVAAGGPRDESNIEGRKSTRHAVPLRRQPVDVLLEAVANIFDRGVAPAEWAKDCKRRQYAARALSWATSRSASGRYTPELVALACERAQFDDFFRTRLRLSYILFSAEHLEELLDDERPAARAARAARLAAEQARTPRRNHVDDVPIKAINAAGPLVAAIVAGSAAYEAKKIRQRSGFVAERPKFEGR